MKPVFEKLTPSKGESFRCFDRSQLRTEVKWHWHPEYEINFVEKGCGTRMVGDHICDFGDGDLVLLGANLPHAWLSDEYAGQKYDRHPSVVVQFRPSYLLGNLINLPEMVDVLRLLQISKRGILFKGKEAAEIGKTISEMVNHSGADRLVGLLNCLNRLSKIENIKLLASEDYNPSTKDLNDDRIRKVCQFINRNFPDPNLDLSMIPQLAAMNSSAFSRLFKKNMGRTLTQYVNELRVGMACRRLINSDKKILEICLEVGFSNLSNFNRRFLELTNTTPSQYRKKFKGKIS